MKIMYISKFDESIGSRAEACTEAIHMEAVSSDDPHFLNRQYEALRARAIELDKKYAALDRDRKIWYGAAAKTFVTSKLSEAERLLKDKHRHDSLVISNLGVAAAGIMGLEYELVTIKQITKESA